MKVDQIMKRISMLWFLAIARVMLGWPNRFLPLPEPQDFSGGFLSCAEGNLEWSLRKSDDQHRLPIFLLKMCNDHWLQLLASHRTTLKLNHIYESIVQMPLELHLFHAHCPLVKNLFLTPNPTLPWCSSMPFPSIQLIFHWAHQENKKSWLHFVLL